MSGQAVTGVYGTLTLGATGAWTYTLNNADPDTNALTQGQVVTDAFTYEMVDANGATSSTTLTITITGTNDAPVAVADGNGGDAVTESGVNPGETPFPGDPSAAGNVLTNDTDVDSGDTRTVTAVNGSALNVGQAVTGVYGTLTLGATGAWTYTLDNADPDTNALAQGQVVTDAFTYTITDANGATSSSTVTITITGTNDAPVAVADGNGGDAVTESGVNPGETPFPGDPSAAGNVLTNDTDVDAGDTTTVTAVNGSAAECRAGSHRCVWHAHARSHRRLDLYARQYRSGHQCPDAGPGGDGCLHLHHHRRQRRHLIEHVTITITGTNDAPVAVADANGGDAVTESGVNPGETPFPGDPSAAGNVLTNDTDVDSGDTRTVTAVNGSAPNVGQAVTGVYGTLTLSAAGRGPIRSTMPIPTPMP